MDYKKSFDDKFTEAINIFHQVFGKFEYINSPAQKVIDRKKRIETAIIQLIKADKICLMMDEAQKRYDGAIESSMKYPEMFTWYQAVANHYLKVLDRLQNYFNNTVSEIQI